MTPHATLARTLGVSLAALCASLVPVPRSQAAAATAAHIELPLWPGGAPGAPIGALPEESIEDRPEGGDRHVRNVHTPTITVYTPVITAAPREGAQRPAIVICPGGGYGLLALDKEGHDVARWLAGHGVVGIVLKYRLPRPKGHVYGHEAPLLDAARALALVRERAAEWDVDPARVGLMGFSAGGHLAASAAVQLGEGGPNFSVLVYPVVSFSSEYGHSGSRDNLLGKDAPEALVRRFSSELQVTAQTPQAFIVHTSDDPVKAENSLRYYEALRAAGVPAELHVFARGGHGYALRAPELPVGQWPTLLIAWMTERGLLRR
ncbi:MAG: alpha/beta hydrolase [Planctomycetota bacterium]